jgi:hypothetical protein
VHLVGFYCKKHKCVQEEREDMNWIVVAESRAWYEFNPPSEYQILLCLKKNLVLLFLFVVKMKSSGYSSTVLHLLSTKEPN